MTAKLLVSDDSCGNKRVYCKKSSFDCLEKQSKELLKTIETCLNRCLEGFIELFYARYGVGLAVDVYPVGFICRIIIQCIRCFV